MIVQLSSGQGPRECQLAVGLLYKELQKEFSDIEPISEKKGNDKDCYISITFRTESNLEVLEGSILWVCKSPYRPNHGRKNWYVDVSIIPEAGVVSKEEDYKIETLHSGGHGGQNVNKVETGVRVTHISTGLMVVCTEERSQYMNKRKAIKRIQEQLEELQKKADAGNKKAAWIEHTRIVRGNPVRTYEGVKFKRIK